MFLITEILIIYYHYAQTRRRGRINYISVVCKHGTSQHKTFGNKQSHGSAGNYHSHWCGFPFPPHSHSQICFIPIPMGFLVPLGIPFPCTSLIHTRLIPGFVISLRWTIALIRSVLRATYCPNLVVNIMHYGVWTEIPNFKMWPCIFFVNSDWQTWWWKFTARN